MDYQSVPEPLASTFIVSFPRKKIWERNMQSKCAFVKERCDRGAESGRGSTGGPLLLGPPSVFYNQNWLGFAGHWQILLNLAIFLKHILGSTT